MEKLLVSSEWTKDERKAVADALMSDIYRIDNEYRDDRSPPWLKTTHSFDKMHLEQMLTFVTEASAAFFELNRDNFNDYIATADVS